MRNKSFKCSKLLIFKKKSGLHGEKRKKLLEIRNFPHKLKNQRF